MKDTTPILVGSGQYVDRTRPDPAASLSPADMAAEAARRALADAGASDDLAASIDVLAVARLFEHSLRDRVMWPNPYGCSNNMPGSVATRLGITPQRLLYAEVGGETPQRLVNQMAEAIHAGEVRAALLTGAEALGTIRHGQRAGVEFNWHEEVAGEFEDLWPDKVMASDYELRHGIALPIHVYALFERARAHELGLDAVAARAAIGELFAPFSRVAATNPYAQFPTARSATEIATPDADNYLLCEPYTRWMVAQDAVNQGAAVVMTSVGRARELGIGEHHWVYLAAYADVDELPVVQRPRLATSYAQAVALHKVLDDAGRAAADIDLIDLYSCFPVAVSGAVAELGLERAEGPPPTLTGGLPYFGGPGNNYSLHAIAEVVQQLRTDANGSALIAANGGYLSKHSVGLYTRRLDGAWQSRSSTAAQSQVDRSSDVVVIEAAQGRATIESCAAIYARGVATDGFVVGRLADSGARFLARISPDDDGRARDLLFADDAIGRPITVSNHGELNYFKPA